MTGAIDAPAASELVIAYCAVLCPAEGNGDVVHHRLSRNGPVAVEFEFVTLSALSTAVVAFCE